jgi:uncharacterized protein YjbJ (UPF0337 family)
MLSPNSRLWATVVGDKAPPATRAFADAGIKAKHATQRRARCFQKMEDQHMLNWDQMEGKWKQLRGKVRQKWGELTDDEIGAMAGKRDRLLGKLQERYGYAREKAEQEVKAWEDEFND